MTAVPRFKLFVCLIILTVLTPTALIGVMEETATAKSEHDMKSRMEVRVGYAIAADEPTVTIGVSEMKQIIQALFKDSEHNEIEHRVLKRLEQILRTQEIDTSDPRESIRFMIDQAVQEVYERQERDYREDMSRVKAMMLKAGNGTVSRLLEDALTRMERRVTDHIDIALKDVAEKSSVAGGAPAPTPATAPNTVQAAVQAPPTVPATKPAPAEKSAPVSAQQDDSQPKPMEEQKTVFTQPATSSLRQDSPLSRSPSESPEQKPDRAGQTSALVLLGAMSALNLGLIGMLVYIGVRALGSAGLREIVSALMQRTPPTEDRSAA
jgi:hypothetical protein